MAVSARVVTAFEVLKHAADGLRQSDTRCRQGARVRCRRVSAHWPWQNHHPDKALQCKRSAHEAATQKRAVVPIGTTARPYRIDQWRSHPTMGTALAPRRSVFRNCEMCSVRPQLESKVQPSQRDRSKPASRKQRQVPEQFTREGFAAAVPTRSSATTGRLCGYDAGGAERCNCDANSRSTRASRSSAMRGALAPRDLGQSGRCRARRHCEREWFAEASRA